MLLTTSGAHNLDISSTIILMTSQENHRADADRDVEPPAEDTASEGEESNPPNTNANENAQEEEPDLEGMFSGMRIQNEPLRNLDDLKEGVTYRSSIKASKNNRDGVVGVGIGYQIGSKGQPFYEASNGRRYDMRRRAPKKCFNCEDRTDITEDEKYHWRLYCPLARGNITI